MEKIRGTRLLEEKRGERPQPVCFIPHKTEFAEVAQELTILKVCKHALMALLRCGKHAWDTGTIPEHGLKGKENVRSKKFKEEFAPGLKEFFESAALPLSGPRPTRFTRQESGAVARDSEVTKELDPGWTKRRLFGKHCCDLGCTVSQSGSGAVKVTQRVDGNFPAGCDDCGLHCSLTALWNCWKEHCGNIVVRKPSRDVCGICCQFHSGNSLQGLC
jgi:hypothetical protein